MKHWNHLTTRLTAPVLQLGKGRTYLLLAVLATGLMTSCTTINEDLDDCGFDYQLDYELRLVTNMHTELETELNTVKDVYVRDALTQYLKGIFSDFAHDVDLSFYDRKEAEDRLHHETHIMDANQSSYTLYLPMREYMHLATANLTDNNDVSLTGDDRCPTSQLLQMEGDTLLPHTTGLFTARQPMDVLADRNQIFHVKLYMVNSATALIIDTTGVSTKDIRVQTTGFATAFHINDSTYEYAKQNPIIKADELKADGGKEMCFCTVNMPSPDRPGQRLIIDTTFVATDASEALWQYRAYVTMPNGKITETILGINRPLHAGELKIIKGRLDDDGVVRPLDSNVGVSVKLDWTPGGEHHIDI